MIEEPWFPLTTERLLLRPFQPDDYQAIHTYAIDPAVVKYMDWGPNTPEVTRTVLNHWLEVQKVWPRNEVSLAVVIRQTGELIGSVRLAIQDQANRTADMGWSFNSAHWRKGYGTEAARALLSVAFGPLDLHRVWATCDTENVGSFGIMEKIGMRREGLMVAHKKGRAGWRDTYLYALLASEYLPGYN